MRPPESPLDLIADAPWPEPYASAPRWLAARGGDELDAARLAQSESAEALLEVVARGGSLGRVALRSLEHAPDRLEVRGELCALTLRAEPATRRLLLAGLLEALTHAPVSEETVNSRADADCERMLSDMARRSDLGAVERDLVLVAARRLRPE